MIRSLGRGGCGCPPHSHSSPETLALLPSLSFSFDPCCPCLQEYIRRQLEEEQRQLEILQQQLLQEQALLLVNGRPRPRLPLSARVASACARVPPVPPDMGDTAVTTLPGASCPAPWLQHAWIPRSAQGRVPSWCMALIVSPLQHWCVCVCPHKRGSPGCCCEVLEAVCSMLGCV